MLARFGISWVVTTQISGLTSKVSDSVGLVGVGLGRESGKNLHSQQVPKWCWHYRLKDHFENHYLKELVALVMVKL